MRTLISAGLLVLLASSALQAAAPQAQAQVASGGLTSPDIVLYDDCASHPIRFDLGLPAYTDDWSADIYVIGPDGLEAGSGFVYGDGAGVGTEMVQLCDDPMQGRYGLRADVEACDYDYNCSAYSISGRSFGLRFPRSQTSLTARSGSRLAFTARVKDERPRGMFPSDSYTDVILQQKKGGRWVRVASGYTDGRGVVRMTVRNAPGRQTFRAKTVFETYDSIRDSVSRAVRL